jgi:hypothetical protein
MKRLATMTVTQDRLAMVEAECWKIALRLRTFGYAEISAEAAISLKAATDIVRSWAQAGKCGLFRPGNGAGRKLFRVSSELQRASDPAFASLRKIWTAMRGLKSFSPTDLSAHATVGDIEIRATETASYCQTLLWAGYLVVKRTAVPGQREAIYRLVRDTGPNPPRARRVRAVFDDNLGELVRVEGQER